MDLKADNISTRGPSVPTEAGGSARPPDSAQVRALDKERFDNLYRGESVPAEAGGSARPSGSEKDGVLNKERFDNLYRGESVPTEAGGSARPSGSEIDSARDRALNKERFEDAYRGEVGGQKKEGIKETGDKGGDPASLSSLFQNRFPETETAGRALADATLEASPAPAAPALDSEKMVSRILVSDPVHSPNNQVRLSLNDSFLPGTEVLIRRDNDGLLTVSFTSSDAGSLQTLLAARPALKEALDQTENREVRLTIVGGDDASGDGDARDRRSKGYVGFETPGDE
jgi:type III secretion system needle length determinant